MSAVSDASFLLASMACSVCAWTRAKSAGSNFGSSSFSARISSVASRLRVKERTVAMVLLSSAAKSMEEPSFCSRSLRASLLERSVASFSIAAVNAARPSLSAASWRWPASMRRAMAVVGVSALRAPSTRTPFSSAPRQVAGTATAGFSPAGGTTLRSKSSTAVR